MDRILTSALAAHAGRRVRMAGWVHHIRRLRAVTFLILRDAGGQAQIVLEEPEALRMAARIEHEAVIEVDGLAVTASQAPGGVEVRQPAITVVAPAATALPVDLFRPTLAAQLPTLLDHAAVTLRHPRRQATFRLAAASMAGFRQALRAEGLSAQGGFAIGLERWVAQIVGATNLRETTLFPRDMQRLTP